MKATDVLRDEHEAVRVAMRILGKICDQIESGAEFEVRHLEQLLDFIRVFTDTCHHGKEEDLLFPAMEEIGIPNEGGPVGVMLSEHETMREYIRNFANALDAYAAGDESAKEAIVENVRIYLSWIDSHIDKENNILFVMADSHLSPDKQEELYEAFETLEEERIGKDVHEQFHQMLQELKAIYLEPKKDGKTKKLVAWKIPPQNRHPKIFEEFENLEHGSSFILENDHDPKPLYYQFQMEREDDFSWEYIQEGPELWQVRIGKV